MNKETLQHYHIRNPCVILLGISEYSTSESSNDSDLPDVKTDIKQMEDLFKNMRG